MDAAAPVQVRAQPVPPPIEERRAVERAFAGWVELARHGLPAATEVAALAAALRPASPPYLDLAIIERMALLARVAEQLRMPVALDAWMLEGPIGPQLVRAALLPARASDGTVAVACVLGAAEGPFT